MANRGRIAGSVALRPLLAAIVVRDPSAQEVVHAVGLASTRWGGVHFLIIDAAGPYPVDKVAVAAGVDFLWTESTDIDLVMLTGSSGFSWTRGGEFGPFSQPHEHYSQGLVEAFRFFDELPDARIAHPRWQADDPLFNFFSVLYGNRSMPGSAAHEAALARLVADDSISSAAPLSEILSHAGVVASTRGALINPHTDAGVGLIGIDPDSPRDLTRFWNLRALGYDVIPVPNGREDEAASELERLLEGKELEEWTDAKSNVAIRYVRWWGTNEAPGPPPPIEAAIKSLDAEPLAHQEFPDAIRRRQMSPIKTDIERRFNVTIEAPDRWVRLPLPEVPSISRERPAWAGRIAAVVEIDQERVAGERVAKIPYYRRLSQLLKGTTFEVEQFPTRPFSEGRIIGIELFAEDVELSLVASAELISALMGETSEWTFGQSDDGHFTARFGDLLGGHASHVANQPALRNVLTTAAGRGPMGISLPEIRQRFASHRGQWPGRISRLSATEYASRESHRLLNSKLLRPVMGVKCTSCRSVLPFSPDQLHEDLTCDFCGHVFPLGLAMSLTGRNPSWGFRLAPHVSPQKVYAALPLLAALSTLSSLERAGGASATPHVFGLTARQADFACEVDVAAVFDDQRPVLVLSEIKNKDSLTKTDVANLTRLSDAYRAAGTETIIMYGTFAEGLTDDEIGLLRNFVESARPTIDPHFESFLAYPLIFTNSELSAHPWDKAHPRQWRERDHHLGSIFEIARETCRLHLGYTADELKAIERNAFTIS